MGYRAYLHAVTSSPLDTAEDKCLGKLIGYVENKDLSKMQLTPLIAFALEYGMQHQQTLPDACYEREVWTMDDYKEHVQHYDESIADMCDNRNEMTLIIPSYMLLPFLIAYYNDQQRFYIEQNKQPPLLISDRNALIHLVAWYDLDDFPFWADSEHEYIIYWS